MRCAALHEGGRPTAAGGAAPREGTQEGARSRGRAARSRSRPGRAAETALARAGRSPTPARELCRWDEPVLEAQTAERGSLSRALEVAADPAARARAAQRFDSLKLAATTAPVYSSHWKTIVRIFTAAGIAPLPMTAYKVDVLGGALKEGGYRSGVAFLERYKRAHIEAGGEVSEQLRLQFRGALRAAVRGIGPTRRAEAFSMRSLMDAQTTEEPVVAGGPRAPGRFAATGTWWLLREIEASLLRIGQITDDGGIVVIDLSATKTDPAGRGRRRAHRCICAATASAELPCPACAVRRQIEVRKDQGATEEDLVFTDNRGGAVSKQAAAETLRVLLRAEGPGRISGHSMRRTGAQLLTGAGVEPWLVEWFGRWGSSAIRAYIEDARARAPETARLAERVQAAVGGGAWHEARAPGAAAQKEEALAILDIGEADGPAGEEEAGAAEGGGQVAEGGGQALAQADVLELVRGTVAEFLRAEEEVPAYVRNVGTGMVHITLKATARAMPRSWAALCGWAYSAGRSAAVKAHSSRASCPGTVCSRCRARALKIGLPVEESAGEGSGSESPVVPATDSSDDSSSPSADATRAGARPRV